MCLEETIDHKVYIVVELHRLGTVARLSHQSTGRCDVWPAKYCSVDINDV